MNSKYSKSLGYIWRSFGYATFGQKFKQNEILGLCQPPPQTSGYTGYATANFTITEISHFNLHPYQELVMGKFTHLEPGFSSKIPVCYMLHYKNQD